MMNKKGLIDTIAEVNGIKKVEAERALNQVLDGIFAAVSAMEAGDKLQLLGDLTFEVRPVAERTFVNPLKRAEGVIEEVTKPAHNKLVVVAGKNLQDAVNA